MVKGISFCRILFKGYALVDMFALFLLLFDIVVVDSSFLLSALLLPWLIYVSRRGPGQEYVKSTLGDIILKLLAYDKSLEVDPLKIYQEMIDNEEVQRPAEADKLLSEVSRETENNGYLEDACS